MKTNNKSKVLETILLVSLSFLTTYGCVPVWLGIGCITSDALYWMIRYWELEEMDNNSDNV